jgi:hypothetical protein
VIMSKAQFSKFPTASHSSFAAPMIRGEETRHAHLFHGRARRTQPAMPLCI